jgi:hypothetical protein
VLKKNIEETLAFIRLCHDIGGSGVKVRPNNLPAAVPVEKTLEQIGRRLGVSKERIRQLETRAVARLRLDFESDVEALLGS